MQQALHVAFSTHGELRIHIIEGETYSCGNGESALGMSDRCRGSSGDIETAHVVTDVDKWYVAIISNIERICLDSSVGCQSLVSSY